MFWVFDLIVSGYVKYTDIRKIFNPNSTNIIALNFNEMKKSVLRKNSRFPLIFYLFSPIIFINTGNHYTFVDVSKVPVRIHFPTKKYVEVENQIIFSSIKHVHTKKKLHVIVKSVYIV